MNIPTVVILFAILLGALLGEHPVSAVATILHGGTKMRQSESLLCCCTQAPQYEGKVLAFRKRIG